MNPMTRLTNGGLGVLLFLTSEVMLIGSLFAVFVALRSANPSFSSDAHHLSFYPALVATGLLLLSSVLIPYSRVSTLILAALFLGIKTYTWVKLWQHGIYLSTSNFWGLYYLMTGLHALHLIVGIGLLGTCVMPRSPELELYWHFVDLVWVTLFATFYLF